MKKAALVARVLLGLCFTVFGLNYFVSFVPMEAPQGAAGELLAGFSASGYFMAFLKATEVLCGLLLLAGVFVPLALVVLAPIVLNIVLFHLFLEPAGLLLFLPFLALHLFLAYAYRKSFAGVLAMRAEVGAA